MWREIQVQHTIVWWVAAGAGAGASEGEVREELEERQDARGKRAKGRENVNNGEFSIA
jgi:hypothetical protein